MLCFLLYNYFSSFFILNLQFCLVFWVGGPLIDEVIRLLEDGEWHSFSEIQEKLNLPKDLLCKSVQFFKEFDLADIDEKQERVKISSSFLNLKV